MPLYDVLKQTATELNGLTVPGVSELGAAKADVAFPVGAQDADPMTPLLFVWEGAPLKERRKTMPRNQDGNVATAGDKRLTHQVAVFVILTMPDAGARNCQIYLELVEEVAKTLRLSQINVPLTNPDTGQQSTLLLIGEVIEAQISVPRQLKNQKIVQFRASVTTEAWENLKA